MKRLAWAAALVMAAVPAAWAATAAQQQLATHETLGVEAVGALAAFAVDPTIVDAPIDAGRVVLRGRRPGDTVVTVVLTGSVESFRVHVEPAPVVLDTASLEQSGRTMGEGRYDSALRRFTAVVSGRGRVGDSDVRVYAETVRQSAPSEGEARTAVPSATVEITNAKRSIVLLDKFVQDSPLTLDGVVLRGVHATQDGWDLHAGSASWSPLEGFLSGGGERAVTVARKFNAGTIRVTPRVAWFPDASGAKTVGAVTLEFGREADALHLRADAGVSGSPGAAVEADYRTKEREAWVRASTRPRDFAALKAAAPPGTQAEGAWNEKLDDATTLSLSGSASALRIADTSVHSETARAELRRQIDPHWSGTLVAGGGDYHAGGSEAVRRGTVGAGIGWDGPDWGASAQYRYQTTSLSDRGGHGARVSAHASANGWRASGFVDVQQQAPTLDLLLNDRTDLARTLAGLGIAAAQPEDILRALRDNASLITGQGTVIGPVRLNPLRTYVGADVSWRASAGEPEIGARVLRDHVEGVVGARSSSVASLYTSWRMGASTDVRVTLSHWTTRSTGRDEIGDTGVQVSVRTFIDRPLIAPLTSAPIVGQVFRDELQEDGAPQLRTPLANVDVVLDRSRRTRTDRDGRYEFDRPGRGSHTIEAVLPTDGAAYFTTPSQLTRDAGGNADFGIALGGVRIIGTVQNDAGLPVAGVAVHAEGATSATAVTDSSGAFRMTVAPGEARFALAPETVPPGHDLRALAPRKRNLASGERATVNFVVHAMRSVEGVVEGV